MRRLLLLVSLLCLTIPALADECFEYSRLPTFRTVRETLAMQAVDAEGDVLCYATTHETTPGTAILVWKRVLENGGLEGLGQFPVPGTQVDGIRIDGHRVVAALHDAGAAVVDFSIPDAAVLLAHVPTVGDCHDADIDGDRLYVADGEAGLRIVDLSDPAGPVELYGGDGLATHAVVAAGPVVYVASSTSYSWSVASWDVTDGAAPVELDQYEVIFGENHDTLRDLRLDGDHLYGRRFQSIPSGPFPWDLSTHYLHYFAWDVSDPTAVTRLPGMEAASWIGLSPHGSYDWDVNDGLLFETFNGTLRGWSIEDGSGFVRRGALTCADTIHGVAGCGDRVWVLEPGDAGGRIRTAALPELSPGPLLSVESAYSTGITALAVAGDAVLTAFVEWNDGPGPVTATGIDRFDYTDPTDPSGGEMVANVLNMEVEDLAVFGDYVYSALGIFEWATGEYVGPFGLWGRFTIHGPALYLDGHGLEIFDLTDPLAPVSAGEFHPGVYVQWLDAEGPRAFLASGETLLEVDLSDPLAPVLVAETPLGFRPRAADLVGALLHLACDDGYRILDVSGPPIETAFVPLDAAPAKVLAHGGVAYVAARSAGLEILDVQTPNAPRRLTTVNLGHFVTDVVLFNGAVLTAMGPDLVLLRPDCQTVLSLDDPDSGDLQTPTAQRTALRPARPNPFNPSTELRFELERPGRAVLTIHDAAGRRVRTLVDETRTDGEHVARWDGRDADGRLQPAGVYFARLQADGAVRTGKLVLVK